MKFKKLCFSLFLAAVVRPQDQQQSSAIEGFVTSDLAAVVPNATIRLDSITKGYHRDTQANASGYYMFDELQSGAYSLCAEVRGLGCIIYPHIALMPGQHLRQDFSFVRTKRHPEGCEPPLKKPPK